jgi:hypothetical protein
MDVSPEADNEVVNYRLSFKLGHKKQLKSKVRRSKCGSTVKAGV